MTEQDIRDWLKDNLAAKLKEFGLSHWRVETIYERMEAKPDGFQPFMSMTARFEYEKASLFVDVGICADNLRGEKELVEYVEHELMHVVHNPLDLLVNSLWNGLTDSQQDLCNESSRMAKEMIVRNMERMVHSLRQTLTDRHQEQFDAVCNEKMALEARVAELEAAAGDKK